jgi:hypothetical protein
MTSFPQAAILRNATNATALITKHLHAKRNATKGLRVAVRIFHKSSIFMEVAEVALQKGESRLAYTPPKVSSSPFPIRPTGEKHPRDWRADPRSLQRKQRNGRPGARRCHPGGAGWPRVSG